MESTMTLFSPLGRYALSVRGFHTQPSTAMRISLLLIQYHVRKLNIHAFKKLKCEQNLA